MRGGSYWNEAQWARSAYRNIRNPRIEIRNQGFRVVLPAAPNPRPIPSRNGPEQARLQRRVRSPVAVAARSRRQVPLSRCPPSVRAAFCFHVPLCAA